MRINLSFDVTPYEAVAITQLNTIWEHICTDEPEITDWVHIDSFAHGLIFALEGIVDASHGESAAFWHALATEDPALAGVLRSRLTEILAAL